MNTSGSSSASSSASSNSPSHLSPTSNNANFFQPTTSSSPLNVVTSAYAPHSAYWPTGNPYATSVQTTSNGMQSNQHYSNYAVAAVAAAAQYPNSFHSLNVASPQHQSQYVDLKFSPTTSVPFLYGIESCGDILNQLAVNATRNSNTILTGSSIKQQNQNSSNIDESLNPNDSGFESPTNNNNNNNTDVTVATTGVAVNNSNNNNNNSSSSNTNTNNNNNNTTLTSSWNNGC